VFIHVRFTMVNHRVELFFMRIRMEPIILYFCLREALGQDRGYCLGYISVPLIIFVFRDCSLRTTLGERQGKKPLVKCVMQVERP
jgi:hypothetical protein